MPTPTPIDAAALKQRTSIVAIASGYTNLQRLSSGEYRGLCPLHAERTPSFDVNEDKGVFLCRGCNRHGDAITLIRMVENLSFIEAARRLEGATGRDYEPSALPQPKPPRRRPEPSQKTYDTRTLRERGITLDTLAHFRISEKRDDMGEIICWYYPTFHPNGKLGRRRAKYRDPQRVGKAKYETWDKDSGLTIPHGYNLQALRKQTKCLVVGGEVGVWLAYQAGEVAICPLGEGRDMMPLSQTLYDVGIEQVDVLLDNDEAGELGAARIKLACANFDINCRLMKWGKGLKRGYDYADWWADKFNNLQVARHDC